MLEIAFLPLADGPLPEARGRRGALLRRGTRATTWAKQPTRYGPGKPSKLSFLSAPDVLSVTVNIEPSAASYVKGLDM